MPRHLSNWHAFTMLILLGRGDELPLRPMAVLKLVIRRPATVHGALVTGPRSGHSKLVYIRNRLTANLDDQIKELTKDNSLKAIFVHCECSFLD